MSKNHSDPSSFFEFSSEMLCICGLDGYFKTMSPAWTTLFGHSMEELLNQSYFYFLHPEDHEKTRKAKFSSSSDLHIHRFENRFLHKDGTFRRISWNGIFKPSEGLFYGIARDLSQERVFLNTVINHLPLALFCKDMGDSLRFIFWNDMASKMWGFSANQVIGKTDYDLFDRRMADSFVAKDIETFKTGETIEIPEEAIETQNQGRKYLHTRKVPIYDEEGNPKFLLGISEDITDSKEVRKQLGIYHQVAQEMTLGLYVYHLEERGNPNSLRLLIANNASQFITGVNPKDIIGKTIFEAFPNITVAQKFHDLIIYNTNTELGKLDYEFPPPMGLQNFNVRAFAIPGDMVGVLFENITEKLQTERALEIERQAAINSARLASLGEMAAGLAHEINNPLSIIKGKAQLLQRLKEKGEATDDYIKNCIEIINSTVDRIATIIRGLRSFARESSQDPLVSCDLKSILDDTLVLCGAKFKNKGITLEIKMPDDFILLDCRPAQISQIILNLLNNAADAVEFCTEKWVAIEITEKNKGIQIAVSDGGPGIPPLLKSKIMEPFFTTKEPGKGTGLGLSISRGLVESHHGKLYLDEKSKQTCFIVWLPTPSTKL